MVAKKTPKAKSLKDVSLAAAKNRMNKALEQAWDLLWEDKNRAAKEHVEDGKDSAKFKYGIGASITLNPKGSGDMGVKAKITWTDKHECETDEMDVSDHPDMFDDDKE